MPFPIASEGQARSIRPSETVDEQISQDSTDLQQVAPRGALGQ